MAASTQEEIARLVKEAAAQIKRDAKGAVASLEKAYALAKDNADDASYVAEELARGWGRRKSNAKSLHYAIKATKLSPNQKSVWTTLAKTCELVATRLIREEKKQRRARALYRAASSGFKKAASMTKDAEDKNWLMELARDAAKQAKPNEGAGE